MATLHYGGQQLPLSFSNTFLAHLQVATHQRFGEGRGFFLSGTLTDEDGVETSFSHWLHPTIPLSFGYDVRDESNERVRPIQLDQNEIDTIVRAMDQAEGVRATEAVWVPFMQNR